MKHLLSIHVYDSTTPSEFDALIELLAGMKSRHAIPDPAPGHPELPLPGMPVAASLTGLAIQAGKPQTVQAWCESRIAAADPLKVAMDDPVEAEDPTRRELPWGDLPEPPPLPEGKTRWVNRGTFSPVDSFDADGRVVRFSTGAGWMNATEFSCDFIHIEAI